MFSVKLSAIKIFQLPIFLNPLVTGIYSEDSIPALLSDVFKD